MNKDMKLDILLIIIIILSITFGSLSTHIYDNIIFNKYEKDISANHLEEINRYKWYCYERYNKNNSYPIIELDGAIQ